MKKLHHVDNQGKIQQAWEKLDSHVLDYVINLIRTSAYVDHTAELNSPYTLVPIIVYCFDKNGVPLTDIEIRKAVKWFYYAHIRARYIGQLQQKLDKDLRIIAESPQPFDDLLQNLADENRLEILPSEFAGRSIRHPLFSMMRWYFKSRGAVCLTTGIGLRKNMGKKYKLENDHIFPYSLLAASGYGFGNRIKYSLAQEMTNRAILTQIANRTKSYKSAEVYLNSVKEQFPHALELQCIPDNQELWLLENYETFLEKRRALLAEHLNTFLSGITEIEETVSPVSIEDMIAQGESDELEFKASLRWDVNNARINKKLEEVVLKTVAAFANSQGGTLLIGVDDEGQILGLDYDLQSLGNPDLDGFEIHLRNLLVQNFGVVFINNNMEIVFPNINDREVCQINVTPASYPVVIKVKDSNGQQVERLFVRSGNSSQEIPISQAQSYFNERFKK
jgi:hypothetical protein